MSQPPVTTGRSSRIAILILVIGGLVFGAAMAFFMIVWGAGNPLSARSIGQVASVPDRVAVGQPAPDFVAQDPDGKMLRLSDFQGSIVALNFWATWCVPCRVEMPELDSAARRFQDKHLVVLGVNAGEEADQVTAYITELGLDFQTVLDLNGTVIDQYEIRAFPTTIWINSKGIVRAKHLGALTREDIDRYVSDLAQR